jgi:hypothetical protein
MARAYVAHPLDKGGFSVVHTLQPVDGLEVCIERVSISPNCGLIVMLKVEDTLVIALLHSHKLRRSSSGVFDVSATLTMIMKMICSEDGPKSRLHQPSSPAPCCWVVAKWKGRDGKCGWNGISALGVYVYIGVVVVHKRNLKGCFISQEPHAHDGRNRSRVMRWFVLRDVL